MTRVTLRMRLASAWALVVSGSSLAVAISSPSPIAVLLVAGASVLAGLVLWYAESRVRRSAQSLAAAAERVAAGDTDSRRGDVIDELRGVADAFGRLAASVGDKLDATSREHGRLRAAIEASDDAITAVDPDGTVVFANAAAEQILGRSREQIVGNPFAWSLADGRVVEGLRAAREEGSRQVHDVELPGQRYLRVITTPMTGGQWAALAIAHDMTEVRRAERIRRDFVANVSHELRTPLTSIKAVIETLEAGALEDGAAARDFLARADAEVDRLAQMVEELLELSRIESGQVPLLREAVDLGAVVRSAFERLRPRAQKRHLQFLLDVPSGLPTITGDAARLEQAVVNLVHNAVKFTIGGGTVRVSAGRDAGGVVVQVRDSGPGITADDLPRVFERFYKADRSRAGGGSGLGLAVVKHTVESHGGRVGVQSEPGVGSTFSFWIPSGDAPAARVQ